MKILFTCAIGWNDRPQRIGGIIRGYFEPLAHGLREFGHECKFAIHSGASYRPGITFPYTIHTGYEDIKERITEADVVFMWGGNSPGDIYIRSQIKQYGKIGIFGELGWFPQKDTCYFDLKGTNANSSIRDINFSTHSLAPSDSIIQNNITAFRENYYKGISRDNPKNYGFVPLQDERDMNILFGSPWKTMDEFVGYLSRRYYNEQLVVRQHPRFKAKLSNYPNVTVDNTTELHVALADAKWVEGINSTVLLEAILMNKLVVTHGEGLAKGITYDNYATFLYELIFNRMIYKNDLSNVDKINTYRLFQEVGLV